MRRGNPVHAFGEADPDQYRAALDVLSDNTSMLAMTRKLGCSRQPDPDDAHIHNVLKPL